MGENNTNNYVNFSKIVNNMIAINEDAYKNDLLKWDMTAPIREYDRKTINDIINSGDSKSQRILSQNYFSSNSFYKEIIIYYATLLKYSGVLVPTYKGKNKENLFLKKYNNALRFIESFKIEQFGPRIAQDVLCNGIYYGVITNTTKNDFAIIDLPKNFSRTRFKDKNGDYIVEFNVEYFDTIYNIKDRQAALNSYPNIISNYYKKWTKNRKKPWVFLPTTVGFAFDFFNPRPYFLDIIPATIDYEDSITNELQKQLNEIKKILVQKVPHYGENYLLDNPEVEEMHRGTVNMLKRANPNLSVLTTHGDATIENISSTDNVTNTTLEKMSQNIYARAGVSSEFFGAKGSSSIPYSLNEDISFMMILANKIANFITNLTNRFFEDDLITFKYIILPITQYNTKDFIEESTKLASLGYSFIVPALALGINQKDLVNLKDLEQMLNLKEKLIPLSSSYTQTNSSSIGRPKLEPGEESEKTLENRESIENTGGE